MLPNGENNVIHKPSSHLPTCHYISNKIISHLPNTHRSISRRRRKLKCRGKGSCVKQSWPKGKRIDLHLSVQTNLHSICALLIKEAVTIWIACSGGRGERNRTLLVLCATLESCLMRRPTSMTGQHSGEQQLFESFWIIRMYWYLLLTLFLPLPLCLSPFSISPFLPLPLSPSPPLSLSLSACVQATCQSDKKEWWAVNSVLPWL